MALGYDVVDRVKEEDIQPSEVVRRYSTEKMLYPAYVICCTEDNPVQAFKVKVLRNMFAKSIGEEETLINIYYSQSEQLIRLGRISPLQVKAVLALFEGDAVDGYLDNNTKLEGDYLYVLSS